MTFGEKLLKLRKENGLSQEALAEKLNTTRQAISKWENDQGFPETEKLLMISNIFEVSVDFLLKDTAEPNQVNDKGYYVSKEMAEAFLLHKSKVGKYNALGFFIGALAFIPYFFFDQDPSLFALPTIIIATVGIGIAASANYMEEDQYKILKQEHLLFDEKYHKELNVRYENMKKKNAVLNIAGTCLFIAGFLPIVFERRGIISELLTQYYPICIALIAVGIFILTRTTTILDGYRLLAKNKEYTNRLSFILRKKMRKKVDEI
jgi:transcriptional regulator with XRE-family HTH domain